MIPSRFRFKLQTTVFQLVSRHQASRLKFFEHF